MRYSFLKVVLPFLLKGLIVFSGHIYGAEKDPRTRRMEARAERRLQNVNEIFTPWRHLGSMQMDSLELSREKEIIRIYLSPAITHIPIRYPWLKYLENEFINQLGRRFRNYQIEFYARNHPLQDFIPNFYRKDYLTIDSTRIRAAKPLPPLVRRLDQPVFDHGLHRAHIALWHSHGYYYNALKDRWEWQRARLFGTIEDLFPYEYVVKYIAPMLENAGANVLLPRERDIQPLEVVVTVGQGHGRSEVIIEPAHASVDTVPGGFALKDTLFDAENPFHMGQHLQISGQQEASITFLPDIPQSGYYPVYVAWAPTLQNDSLVHCEVYYAGGKASFQLNQQMGHATWIYLGRFYFKKGKNPEQGRVVIHSSPNTKGVITADAVRFGAGMGNVARRASQEVLTHQPSVHDHGNSTAKETLRIDQESLPRWKTSERPRYMEGARYFLQYSGMPDTLVYSLNEGKNDYNDDYMSRGEWVNYLTGAPLGPMGDRQQPGLGIPIDLSLAFHTDAGITKGDSVIGTLSIYSAQRDEGMFPDGVSRLASRDLTDIIQDHIVSDIRQLYNPSWTQRAIWDRQYSEAWRPNVPAMLLELLSHQNLADMKFGLEPEFQFSVSRAIYKGIARFVAHQEGRQAIIQPLPPSHFGISVVQDKTLRLTWQPVSDVLEPTAKARQYRVYMRKEGEGFDQGVLTYDNFLEIDLPHYDTLYSFKVTALNEGGESFPSETLSAAIVKGQQKTVLIVNGFQRLSAPAMFDTGQLAGLTWWDDHAIPYQYTVSHTGSQYDYSRQSPWLDDDSPGWGASYADKEGLTIAGNTFDYPAIHGDAVRNAGYSFVSVSRQVFEQDAFRADAYWAIGYIMGKQKGTPYLLYPDRIRYRVFTPETMQKLREYTLHGGHLILSGAYVGTDQMLFADTAAMQFTKNVLGYSWRTNNASISGEVKVTDQARGGFPGELEFATVPNAHIYHVEAPDAIEAEGENSIVVYRYTCNHTSAAVWHNGRHKVFSMGFPFETLIHHTQRNELMRSILLLFESN